MPNVTVGAILLLPLSGKVVEAKQGAGCVRCFEQAKLCPCGVSPDTHETVSFRLGIPRGIEILRVT